MCRKVVHGRADKVFCSAACKSTYHQKLNKVTTEATSLIDKILHRNRSIHLELMGKTATQKKIPKTLLDSKKFNYSYITGFHINKQKKTVYNVYDFSYIPFSTQDVLIMRNLKIN